MQTTPNNPQQLFLEWIIDSTQPWIICSVLFASSLVLMSLIGNPLILWLQNKRWKKNTTAVETWAVREDTPESHQKKQGTPSMGGIGIIASTLLSCMTVLCLVVAVFVFLPERPMSWREAASTFFVFALPLPIALFSHGVLGFADDYSKASGRGGLKARHKLLWQIILATLFIVVLCYAWPDGNGQYFLKYEPHSSLNGFFVLATLALIVVATCNAVNLTDGIDGLAAGLAAQTGTILFFIGDRNLWENSGMQAAFCLALAGACLGFLFFNRYPARVFMGDTGSLAIGAALGAGAILQHAVFLLPFIGFIYFVEMFSVIAQVLWFKWTKRKTGEGKRLFRRAPLHHHFELCGWSEWRVVGTFWMVNLFTSAIGLWLWHLGVLPRWP